MIEKLDAWKWDYYALDHALSVSQEWVLNGLVFSIALSMFSLFLLVFMDGGDPITYVRLGCLKTPSRRHF